MKCEVHERRDIYNIYVYIYIYIYILIVLFYMQVTEARSTLKSPQIHNAQFERGAKFWCHFCVEEELKHMELDTCTVKYGGLIEHIARYFVA